ncbi:MAG TPA: endonuclease/exonuclease/phosphatase family protein [Thermomicrobiales bacterium]|nr:endonuclease/exonuclease/phosphatase family protein [Thermomicrobiales bacterium]
MGRRWKIGVLGALLLLPLFAQGCLRASPPAPSPTPAPTPKTRLGAGAPAATASPASSPATDTPVPTLAPTPTPAATPTSGPPTSTPPPPTPPPTPTEPRLGINPPASPAVGVGPATPTPAPRATPGRAVTIARIAGGPAALAGQTVSATGVVIADFRGAPARGFFLQDPAGDGDAATPDGIFVYQGGRDLPDVKVGDSVTASGVVRASNGRVALDVSAPTTAVTVNSSGNPLPAPVELRPPRDDRAAVAYFAGLSGMLVTVPRAVVVGPTGRGGAFTVVRADADLARVFRDDPGGTGERIAVGAEGGPGARYDLAVGDQVFGLIGPLDYAAGQYALEQLPDAKLLVVPGKRDAPAVAPATPGEFTVASFNLADFFDPSAPPGDLQPCDVAPNGAPCQAQATPADYQRRLAKASLAVRDALGAPALVAVQEVENLDVLKALAAQPALAPYHYGAVLLPGDDPLGGNVGLLYRQDRVTVRGATQRNACTVADYGFTDADARCSTRGNGILDGHELAARPPLVVTLDVHGADGARPLTLIVVHFTALGGGDPAGQGLARRTAEAQLVAGIVNETLAHDPDAAVIVAGDLNDVLGSDPLRALTALAPLRELALDVPPAERYSFIDRGASEVLDHILVTPNLVTALVDVTYAHFDADYPASRAGDTTVIRVSDHDPPVARFRLSP